MGARSKIFGRNGKRIFKTKFSHEGTKTQRKQEARRNLSEKILRAFESL
jgi:hypothetical protein